jgi:hypothetical protein
LHADADMGRLRGLLTITANLRGGLVTVHRKIGRTGRLYFELLGIVIGRDDQERFFGRDGFARSREDTVFVTT